VSITDFYDLAMAGCVLAVTPFAVRWLKAKAASEAYWLVYHQRIDRKEEERAERGFE
jgi:hypothetical protein